MMTLTPLADETDPESLGQDPFDAITGVVWGSLAGGAFWLMAFMLAACIVWLAAA